MSETWQGAMGRGRARLGVVVPISNINLEPDLGLLCPPGVSFHVVRAGGYDVDAVPDGDQLRKFALASMDAMIGDLAATRPDIILYGCTAATLSHGPTFDRTLTGKIEALAGVPAVTAAGAVVETLNDLGAKRVGFSSSYVETLNADAVAFFAGCGIEVVNVAYVGEDIGNEAVGALTPADVVALGRRADHPDAEAIVLSCTDMRAVEAIAELEGALGKPVVTSNQALVYAATKRLGMAPGAARPGRHLAADPTAVADAD